MSKRVFLLRISMDLGAPSIQECQVLSKIFHNSPSLLTHSMILQTATSPAIVSFKTDYSVKLLDCLSSENWESNYKELR